MNRRKPFFIISEDDYDYIIDTLSEVMCSEDIETCKAHVRLANRRLEHLEEEEEE